ncbi:type II secretion system protein [Dehalogenimonas etheniformans]|uniref:Type II secretion system protein n=1 Tax=Dehalogenimonas etheniformans TaxID=1536648 RepID=A0A2P5P8I6_9CHLR|nr:type II secretion system protein [Dehalogenimonas etheniformans]PPD58613.1 type II secretion system protein [Dehalogenimonas etheniformans]QNT76620.1 type II secretion system protein [Dehalogenimonas etheniformans]
MFLSCFKLRRTRGFTLVELLVGMAILGFLMAALSMTTMQIMKVNQKSQNQAMAIRQVQSAGQYISKDALQANIKIVMTTPNGFTPLKFTEDFNNIDLLNEKVTIVTYTISNGNLLRQSSVNGVLSPQITVATGVLFSTNSSDPNYNSTWFKATTVGSVTTYELKITVRYGSGNTAATETRYYKIEPRPDNV